MQNESTGHDAEKGCPSAGRLAMSAAVNRTTEHAKSQLRRDSHARRIGLFALSEEVARIATF